MKLSEQLKQDHDSGDCGKALEGYSEKAQELENLIELCAKDIYSGTGVIKRKTALAIYTYVNKNGIEV
jgi:hypothetical protein